jgi:hypothetical protein
MSSRCREGRKEKGEIVTGVFNLSSVLKCQKRFIFSLSYSKKI